VQSNQAGIKAAAPALGQGAAPAASERPPLQSFEERGIPDQFRSVVEKELTAGEEMLWLGRPAANLRPQLPKQAFLYISLGFFGLGLLIAVIGGFHMGALLFGGAFGIFGLVLLVPYYAKPNNLCSSCYVVTNRRAIVLEMAIFPRVPRAKSYLPHQLVGLDRQDHATVPGAGDLVFEYVFALGGSANLMTGAGLAKGYTMGRMDAAQRMPHGFLLIENVRAVERLIRTTLLGQMEAALDDVQATPEQSSALGQSSAQQPQHQQGIAAEAAPAGISPSSLLSSPVAIPDICREDGAIPAELKAKALGTLDANEKVVWVGQPNTKLILIRSSGYLVGGALGALAMLIWVGYLLIPQQAANAAQKKGATQQAAKNAPAPQSVPAGAFLPPAAFLLLSLGCTAVPFVRRYVSQRTLYALTNRRALVFKQGLFGPTRDSYSPLEVTAMRRADSWVQSGSGDLIFRTVQVLNTTRYRSGRTNQSVTTTHYGFLAINHPKDVEKLVRETLIDRFVDKLQQANAL
jgi:hypothetical protein